MKLKYRRGIFLIVYSEQNKKIYYLILKRKLHWKGWEFPKGGIKKKESVIKAVRRELNEESGLKPLAIKKFNLGGKYPYNKIYSDRKNFKGQTYLLFAAQVKPGKIKIDKLEHSKYKWMSFKDAMRKLTWANQKKCLKIVNSWIKRE